MASPGTNFGPPPWVLLTYGTSGIAPPGSGLIQRTLTGVGLALALAIGLNPSLALGQTKFTMPPPAGVFLGGYQVVTTCGAASGLVAGNLAFGAMDTTGAIC